ncbi:MAG TPA: YciI family protein [Vicinamibacterales bacterium]|nr:YciI family protein [Vicinamibacterales bacterium]
MQFVMLIYEPTDDINSRSGEQPSPLIGAWRLYYKAMVDAGVYVGGAPLQPEAMGTTVRVSGGQRHVHDGPYADTKEQLGGFIILELPSLDAALDWAARCPTAARGAVEVRPISEEVRVLVEQPGG